MPNLCVEKWNGRTSFIIEHYEYEKPRERTGNVESRIPITEEQARLSLEELGALFHMYLKVP